MSISWYYKSIQVIANMYIYTSQAEIWTGTCVGTIRQDPALIPFTYCLSDYWVKVSHKLPHILVCGDFPPILVRRDTANVIYRWFAFLPRSSHEIAGTTKTHHTNFLCFFLTGCAYAIFVPRPWRVAWDSATLAELYDSGCQCKTTLAWVKPPLLPT